MKSPIFLFFFLFIAAVCADKTAPCYTGCRFYICSERIWHAMPGQDLAFTGKLCDRRNANISHVHSGEARVYTNSVFRRISKWKPSPELAQPYSPHFFKTIAKKVFIYVAVNGKLVQKSLHLPHVGIAREYFQKNQADFFKDRCVVLPIKSWQEVNVNGHVVRNVVSKQKFNRDCVAFRT